MVLFNASGPALVSNTSSSIDLSPRLVKVCSLASRRQLVVQPRFHHVVVKLTDAVAVMQMQNTTQCRTHSIGEQRLGPHIKSSLRLLYANTIPIPTLLPYRDPNTNLSQFPAILDTPSSSAHPFKEHTVRYVSSSSESILSPAV